MADYKNDIDKYLKGELTPAQMHALEKKALDDPFLADALEGIQQLQPHELLTDLNKLHSDINKRIERKSSLRWVWIGRIAAGLLLLAVSTYIIILVSNRSNEKSNLALNRPAPETKNQLPLAADSGSMDTDDTSTDPPADIEDEVKKKEARPDQSLSSEQKANEPLAKSSEAKPQLNEEPGDEEKVGEEETNVSEITVAEEKAAPLRAKDSAAVVARQDTDEGAAIRSKTDANESDKKERVAGAAARRGVYSFNTNRKIVRGKVTFAEDGTGLPGVNVIVKGSNEGTVTDGQGNYEISVDQDQPTLMFSFIGFNSKEAEATSEELNVGLDADVSELSEVVVVGYASTSGTSNLPSAPPVVELATPEGGRKYFKKYLQESLRYPEQALKNNVEGKVTIQFTIGTTGQLSDFRVIRGIGYGCDEEVIRLIQAGPKWSPTKRNEEPLKDRVRVRMRFALPKK